MKSVTLQRCLDALSKDDLETAEALLLSVAISPAEPAASALAQAIRTRIDQRRPAETAADGKRRPEQVRGGTAVPDTWQRGACELLSRVDVAPPLPGISLVVGCMNREENLLKALGSWLATDVNEIVIVDWSSASEVWPKLAKFSDPRIKVIRIDGEKRWVLTHALNVGLRFARHELVLKVDCDIQLGQDFFRLNALRPGEFLRGFWKMGLEQGGDGQQFINGTFGAYKKDLRLANYYDERILTYGWDDSDLYQRLTHNLGLAARLIKPNTLRHLDQSQEQRIGNQRVARIRFLDQHEPTEFHGLKNKYYTAIAGNWKPSFVLQDYSITRVKDRLYRGVRTTTTPAHDGVLDRISEALAIRDLALWSRGSMLQMVQNLDEVDLGLAGLLLDAHRVNKSLNLLEAIKNGRKIFFIRCLSVECRAPLYRTIAVLSEHYPSFAQALVLIDSSLEYLSQDLPAGHGAVLLFAQGELLDRLARRTGAKELKYLEELEDLLASGASEAYSLSVSVESLTSEAIRKASQFSDKLVGHYQAPATPLSGGCLVTSLYDEQNLIRLIEYLACVVENLAAFERVVIYYEAADGLLGLVLHKISEELSLAPGRLLLLPYQKRPTFEELFAVQSLLPAISIVAVSNADIVFDASFSRIKEVDLAKNVAVLTRRDISKDGRKASLVRLDTGVPNTLSADAWVVSSPFQPDFFLDYQIGTMQCDSFINHQLSTSSRYGVLNPCLDIKVFHLHDERFNSSVKKQIRDAELIKKNYHLEKERNGGVDPVKGLAWSTLAGANIVPDALKVQQWNAKAVTLDLARCSEPSFGHFLILHLLYEAIQGRHGVAMIIRLRERDLKGTIGTLLARYQAHFLRSKFLFDLDDAECSLPMPSSEGGDHGAISAADAARWIADGTLHSKIEELLSLPTAGGTVLSRLEVSGELSTAATLSLCRALQQQKADPLRSLFAFFQDLPAKTAEQRMVTPFIAPLLDDAAVAARRAKSSPASPSVSFVTSLFNGGAFLPGYLENVLCAAKEAGGEVIIIDANADDRDARVVHDFLERHPESRDSLVYHRLNQDPGLYACWQLGIEMAKAELITNANIDDRRCPHHTARLVQRLHEHPEYDGACGSISCVRGGAEGGWFALQENELWFFNDSVQEIGFADLYRVNERQEVLSRNVMHCMPVWRKSLHRRYGYFDERSYGTSADWAFWLKCAKAGARFLLDKAAFGRYYLNPDSHNRRNDPQGVKELRIIKDFIGVAQDVLTKQ